MDICLLSLLFAAFTESYIVYQIIIYAPFYIGNETHALDATINLFVALTLSSYPLGLVIGHKLRIKNKCDPKKSLLLNFVFNMIGLIIMSDSTVFDRSIYHFVIGNFIMGFLGNSWNNLLSLSYLLHLQKNYKYNELHCYICVSHGIGTIFASLIGAFVNINNGKQINFIDTPFIISISFCALTIIFIHFKLNINDCDAQIAHQQDNEHMFLWHNKGYDHNYALQLNSNSNPMSILINNKLFLILFIICILLLFIILSFDILFPTYCSISSINGGMGWSSHYVGIFYIFYTFSWLFLILYNKWKLSNGYSVTTSFTNSSLKTLKFNCLTLVLIYGVIFPFCINSASINHSEWKPISWLLLGIILAILLGIVSASTSYHITQSFYDLISTNNYYYDDDDMIYCLFIILSNALIYIRLCLPIIIQFTFVISIHLNHTMVSKHLHSTREWYQIGNFIFYVLASLGIIALILLIIYDNLRRDQYGEQIDSQEMNRLITELRKESNASANCNNNIIEDFHGVGFWLSINSKSILSANISHPLCFKNISNS